MPGACFLFLNSTAASATSEWADICPSDYLSSPQIQIVISDTATVVVQGSIDPDNIQIDYSNGGFTATTSRQLKQGIRYWRAVITANTGTVSVGIGEVPMSEKGWKAVNLRSRTAGTPVP